MERPEKFELNECCARYSPERNDSLDAAAALIANAIAYCHENRIAKLLVDAIRLPGFPPEILTTVERYWIVTGWAQKSRGLVIVAIVIRPEYIDGEKFGVTVAHNAGMWADVFPSESRALEFLQHPYSQSG